MTLSEVGGAQSYVADLVPALMEDMEVIVAAQGEGPLAERVRAAGARYVPLRFVRRDLSPLDLVGLVETWLLCLRLRPDVVHANSSKAGALGRLAALLAGVPNRVFTTHGWAFAAASGRRAALYRAIERALGPVTSTVICVSERERARGLAARACNEGNVLVIRNAVDTRRFAASRHAGCAGPVEIVSVGRLAPPKDFETLLLAVAELPRGSVRLRIAGDGPGRPDLERLAGELALDAHVELVGTIADVAPLLAEADVFVLSSRSEGMPMSVLEAMAASLPVVASDVGGIPELVDDTNGFLVPAGDATALAEALAELVTDAQLRRRLGAASRRRATDSFGLDAWRERHRELYAGMLGVPVASGITG